MTTSCAPLTVSWNHYVHGPHARPPTSHIAPLLAVEPSDFHAHVHCARTRPASRELRSHARQQCTRVLSCPIRHANPKAATGRRREGALGDVAVSHSYFDELRPSRPVFRDRC
eukprot:scaffold202686_cov24-Tisochrysis_lutea.AAC.1